LLGEWRFVMAGGGTGGHVFPGLAVARELRDRGHSVVFVGTASGVENRLVPREGFPLRLLEVGPLKQVSWGRRLRTAAELPGSILQAASILEEARAQAVFSMGGYSSGPVMLMAWAKGIPVVAMEPNAMPGFAHRSMAPLVTRALLGFQEGIRHFPAGRAEVTGVPIRQEFFELPAKAHRAPFTVLITGGSQGSHRLNTAEAEALKLWQASGWLERLVFLHQSGQNEYNEICFRYREHGATAEVTPFVEDMPQAFGRADVVVCRSGASTVAELCAAAKASILVPYPFAADQHQLRNAEAMQTAGAARLVPDAELTGQRLFEELSALLDDPSRLAAMEQAARRLARPRAAKRAADILEEVVKKPF
jgi:UDP-N-acetylglucosamine--N-acetylmuramyl-(pentapeptide) pyrophosphoryl-undecaprenol N-acetylglucosamine transferase